MSVFKTFLPFIFFLFFFQVARSGTVSITGSSEIECYNQGIEGIENSSGNRRIIFEKKYFRIGKKIFRNPMYKSHEGQQKNKVSTIMVILLTGPLGGHRLYLGTKPVVPVVYAVTLGGGIFVLPVLDIIAVLVTKDLNRYIDNGRIIMWIE